MSLETAEQIRVAARKIAPDVVQMTSVHPVFDTRIFHKISCSLAQSGLAVTLVVPHDKDERVNGVDIRGVPPSNGRLGRILLTAWRVARAAYRTKARICHFHDPELMPAGIILKLLGRKVIFDVHEDLPRQIEMKAWIPRVLRRMAANLAEAMEWITARIVDRVVVATPTIGRRFPEHKTVLVQNFPILGELAPATAGVYTAREPVVAYVGNVTPERGGIEMVKAIGLVDPALHAKLHLAGNIVPKSLADAMAKHAGWQHTKALGFCSRPMVRDLFEISRLALILFHPEANHINAQPNKLFEYMSAGLPVIASDFPLWRQIVDGAGAGLLVDPLDPAAVARSIEWLLTHEAEAAAMGQRGMQAVRETYNWQQEEAKLLAMYDELLPDCQTIEGIS